jgi:hypothetical protein
MLSLNLLSLLSRPHLAALSKVDTVNRISTRYSTSDIITKKSALNRGGLVYGPACACMSGG